LLKAKRCGEDISQIFQCAEHAWYVGTKRSDATPTRNHIKAAYDSKETVKMQLIGEGRTAYWDTSGHEKISI
jgi:hypothetical protein